MAERIIARRITSQVEETFDLSGEQKDATRDAVDRVIDKAPDLLRDRINTFVASLDGALASGLNEENLLELEDQLDAFGDVVAVEIIAESAPLLATLSDAQIAHGEAQLAKRFEEDRKPLSAPPEKRIAERQEKFIEAVEDWTGSLSDQQERTLRNYVTTLPDNTAHRINASEQRVERMATVLKTHPGSEAIGQALLKEWKARDDWGPNAPAGTERRAQARSTLRYIDGLMTPKQRQHARDHLSKMHRRIMRFIGDGES